MLLIAWSLSAVLSDHARRAPATISSPLVALAHSHSPLTLVVDGGRSVSESVVDAMVAETAAIWKPLGVEVRRRAPGYREPPAATVRVVLANDPDDALASEKRLGWIHFLAPGDPEPIVYVSRFAALQLLDSQSTLRQYPETRRNMLLARMLGRALAHELGHYLLASTAHTSYGLMRSTWSLDALVGNDRVGFGLPVV
jgi:hypothetical protein